MNRPDISVLVVEKSINPLESEQSKHDISDVAYFLKGYGFTVDLVWTLSEHKFKNFGEFFQSIVDNKRRYDILRKDPINSVDDLATYDFLVIHPDFKDCDECLSQILIRYPDKPIILPKGSVVAGVPELYTKDFKIEDVKKDQRYETVYIVDTVFDVELSVLTLIEYILDNREKTSQRPQKFWVNLLCKTDNNKKPLYSRPPLKKIPLN